jgi:hypothetical protein
MPIIAVQMSGRIQWVAKQSPLSRRWVGICEPMNLTTEADSLDELFSVIDETMQLVLRDLLEDNELNGYLRDMGWTAAIPAGPAPHDAEFDVPWVLVAEKNRDPERRAA